MFAMNNLSHRCRPAHRGIVTVVLMLLLCLASPGEARAYENKECLVCHKDYGRAPDILPEGVSELYVDQEQWEKDVHFEVVGLACDDCHSDATPETHPEGGLQKVNCAECHEEQAASYYKTPHWTAEAPEGMRKADCADCHTPHAIRYKQDAESTVYKGKVKEICLSCHTEKASSFGLANKLLLFRVSAHRKSDWANPFNPSECVNCHYTQAVGHGDDPLTGTHCAQCHTEGAGAGKVVFGPFHLDPSLKDRPLLLVVELLNIFILLALPLLFFIWIVRGFMKSRGNKTVQAPGGS